MYMNDKIAEYNKLVACRKLCRKCRRNQDAIYPKDKLDKPDLINPNEVKEVADTNDLSKWSEWHGNLDARILLIAQDFFNLENYRICNGEIESEGVPLARTNRNLIALFKELGVDIGTPRKHDARQGVFFTNAVLCLKQGSKDEGIDRDYFRNCGASFLCPLIKIIKPKIVITLGRHALDSVMVAFEQPFNGNSKMYELVEENTPKDLPNGTKLFPFYHCSPHVTARWRTLKQQMEDWKKVLPYL